MQDIFTKLFEQSYDTVMSTPERSFLQSERKRLLSCLRGEILEIGSGTGVNFPFYQSECNVTALEPSAELAGKASEKFFQNNDSIQAKINIVQAGLGESPWDDSHKNASYDAIVCTLVLCTIPDPQSALSLFKKWLKPNGSLIILEHVQAKNPIAQISQYILNPVWNTLAGGCNLHRPTAQYIREAGFKPVELRELQFVLPFISAVYSV